MYKQNYSSLWIHLIWTTKNCEPVINKNIKKRLYNLIRDKAKEIEVHLDHINGVEDHVHILVSIEPKHKISDVVKSFKGASSKKMNDSGLNNFYFDWQDGFAAISVSPSNVSKVRAYIRNQEKHHRNKSFESEMLSSRVMAEKGAA